MISKAEKTRAYIIDKVASLFNRKGYAGTSIQEIMRTTGLSKGSIYGNFKDKDALAVEVFRYNYHQLAIPLKNEVLKYNSTVPKLLAFVGYYKKNYQQIFANGGCAILNTAIEADDTHPALKLEVVKAIEAWKIFIEEILENGIAKNEIKKIDPGVFAINMIASIEGTILLAKTTGQYKYLKQNLDRLEITIKTLEL